MYSYKQLLVNLAMIHTHTTNLDFLLILLTIAMIHSNNTITTHNNSIPTTTPTSIGIRLSPDSFMVVVELLPTVILGLSSFHSQSTLRQIAHPDGR